MHPLATLNDLYLRGNDTMRSALPDAPVLPVHVRRRPLLAMVTAVRSLHAPRRTDRRPVATWRVRPAGHVRLNLRNHGRIGACPE